MTSMLAGRVSVLRWRHPAGRALPPTSNPALTPVAAAARLRSAAACGSRARRARPRPPSRAARPCSARRPSSFTRRASAWRRQRRRWPGRRAERSGAAHRPATSKLPGPLAQRLRRRHGPPQVRLAAAAAPARREAACVRAGAGVGDCAGRRCRCCMLCVLPPTGVTPGRRLWQPVEPPEGRRARRRARRRACHTEAGAPGQRGGSVCHVRGHGVAKGPRPGAAPSAGAGLRAHRKSVR